MTSKEIEVRWRLGGYSEFVAVETELVRNRQHSLAFVLHWASPQSFRARCGEPMNKVTVPCDDQEAEVIVCRRCARAWDKQHA